MEKGKNIMLKNKNDLLDIGLAIIAITAICILIVIL